MMHRNRGHTRQRTNTAPAAAAAVADPFGPDGFGDSWDKEEILFDSESDKEIFQSQESYSGAEFDWGISDSTAAARRMAEEAESKRRREKYIREERAAAAKFIARKLKGKAAKEAAEAKKAVAAKQQWDQVVDRANAALALAKPADALRILYSLYQDESFYNTVDMEEQKNIAQMVEALESHYELQKSLSKFQTESSQEEDTGSTIGGDTVEVNHSGSTIGGDTVEVNRQF